MAHRVEAVCVCGRELGDQDGDLGESRDLLEEPKVELQQTSAKRQLRSNDAAAHSLLHRTRRVKHVPVGKEVDNVGAVIPVVPNINATDVAVDKRIENAGDLSTTKNQQDILVVR